MKILFVLLLFSSFISLSQATERKQPGVKYTDTLKQKRADDATSAGRVTPKQPGVNYNDTLRQTDNNLSGSNDKIPGQSYSSTIKGTAEGKDNNKNYNIKNLGNIQNNTIKEKLKKKYGIKKNTQNAYIDPSTGQIITLKELNLLKLEIDKHITDLEYDNEMNRTEAASYLAEMIIQMYNDSDEVIDLLNDMDKETKEQTIEGLVFILNYTGIPVRKSQFNLFPKSDQDKQIVKENIEEKNKIEKVDVETNNQNFKVKVNSNYSEVTHSDLGFKVEKHSVASKNSLTVYQGVVNQSDWDWSVLNLETTLDSDRLNRLLIEDIDRFYPIELDSNFKKIKIDKIDYTYTSFSLNHKEYKFGYIFAGIKGDVYLEGYTITKFNSALPNEKLVSVLEQIVFF